MLKYLFSLLILVSACSPSAKQAQQQPLSLLDSFKRSNLQQVFLTDSFYNFEDGQYERHQRSQPLAFIDSNFQRLYIHFNSVQKNPNNALEYLCSGATRVHNTICHFKGSLKIKNAFATRNEFADSLHHCATIIFDVKLYEDSIEFESGFFSGQLEYDVLLDSKFNVIYDGLEFYSDNYSNNRFTGQWQNYKTGEIKICGWGDYRIPNSNDLDIGTGEFSVNDRFVKNGWQDYMNTWGTHGDTARTNKARANESLQWWKE